MSLRAEGLACVRGDRHVFSGLDFSLEAGCALLVRGPNGAGKSSLLRLVATLLKPAQGRLCWDGVDLWEDLESHRARLNYIGHLDAVKPLMTAAENVAFWAALRGGDEDRSRHAGVVGAVLDAFGIEHLADLPVRLLSAGQRRRVALARLVVSEAPLWLLDEPTASLDDDGIDRLARAIRRRRQAGGMVVAATHVDFGVDDSQLLRLG